MTRSEESDVAVMVAAGSALTWFNAALTEQVFCVLQPPLVQAIFNRNAEEVQLLLHKKEDVNALVCMYACMMCV